MAALTEARVRELERYAEAARGLKGWELAYAPEPLVPGPPWSYEDVARELCGEAGSVLDLGTGGGEVLTRVLSGATLRAVATEEWHVNAPVAARHLADVAPVVRASSLELPFPAGAFDLVLSRHEEIRPTEVARVLVRGGRLLTEQVVPDHWHELRDAFPDMTRFPDHYTQYRRALVAAGLTLEDAREFRHPVRFRELGHLVYHLVACPWTVPGFGVRTHLAALARLERQARSERGLVLTEGFYLLRLRAGGQGARV